MDTSYLSHAIGRVYKALSYLESRVRELEGDNPKPSYAEFEAAEMKAKTPVNFKINGAKMFSHSRQASSGYLLLLAHAYEMINHFPTDGSEGGVWYKVERVSDGKVFEFDDRFVIDDDDAFIIKEQAPINE